MKTSEAQGGHDRGLNLGDMEQKKNEALERIGMNTPEGQAHLNTMLKEILDAKKLQSLGNTIQAYAETFARLTGDASNVAGGAGAAFTLLMNSAQTASTAVNVLWGIGPATQLVIGWSGKIIGAVVKAKGKKDERNRSAPISLNEQYALALFISFGQIETLTQQINKLLGVQSPTAGNLSQWWQNTKKLAKMKIEQNWVTRGLAQEQKKKLHKLQTDLAKEKHNFDFLAYALKLRAIDHQMSKLYVSTQVKPQEKEAKLKELFKQQQEAQEAIDFLMNRRVPNLIKKEKNGKYVSSFSPEEYEDLTSAQVKDVLRQLTQQVINLKNSHHN